MLLNLISFVVPDFPTGDGPVSEETKRYYARCYLERQYEIQGRDTEDLTDHDIDILLAEIDLLDVVSNILLIYVLWKFMSLWLCKRGANEYGSHIDDKSNPDT